MGVAASSMKRKLRNAFFSPRKNLRKEKAWKRDVDEKTELKYFNPMPPHVPYGLRGLPLGCGRSVTDF
jgi:hypothetical protein